jgi:hypothetical protein
MSAAWRCCKASAKLDSFNKRAANSLFLLEELATYKQIESAPFHRSLQAGSR